MCQRVKPAIEEGNMDDDEDISVEHERVKKATLE